LRLFITLSPTGGITVITRLEIENFIELVERGVPVIDTRSPAEYAQGHLPGSINMPLFNNEERAEIGTLYKQAGKQAAVMRGLEIAGPSLRCFVEQAAGLSKKGEIALLCWRGGMRSGAMAWLYDTAGIDHIYVLNGGYKRFRQSVIQSFEQPFHKVLVSGKTGTGKTLILYKLEDLGAQVIDLEKLAHHKGSAFGGIGEPPQPTNEHFENRLFMAMRLLDREKLVWIEDESRHIGRIKLPDAFFNEIRKGKTYFIEVPEEYRICRLVNDYAQSGDNMLAEAIGRIERKLGGLQTKLCLEALAQKKYETVAELLLRHYYDKLYTNLIQKRLPSTVHHLRLSDADPLKIATHLLALENVEKQT